MVPACCVRWPAQLLRHGRRALRIGAAPSRDPPSASSRCLQAARYSAPGGLAVIRIALICTTAVTATVLAACGSAAPEPKTSARTSHIQDSTKGFRGCGPASVSRQFGEFLSAVSERHQDAALEYISRPGDLLGVTLYRVGRPGVARIDAETPIEVFESFAAAIAENQPTALLAVAVGDVAPFAGEYEDRVGSGPTAGAEIVARIGRNTSLSGKIGLDCNDGRVYLGAMNTRQGLRPQIQCGKRVRLGGREPILCRI